MYTSSILAVFASVLALTSAVPAPGRTVVAREAPHIDVLVQTSAISDPNVNAHAVQVILGEVKVCIGDKGSAPCNLSKMSISPWGNNTDTTKVECQGFSDTKGLVPTTSIFTVGYPAVLSWTSNVIVGSIICDCY